jgi:excisionase family DNA binding protein
VRANIKKESGPPPDSTWLKLPEAAADMRISLSMLHALIAAGEIKAVHPGPQTTRIPRSEIRAYTARLLEREPGKREPEEGAA